MAVNIHITIIELNALHTKRQNLFQELDAVIHLLMEAKHWGLRKSRNEIGRAVQQECRDRDLHSFPTRRSSDLCANSSINFSVTDTNSSRTSEAALWPSTYISPLSNSTPCIRKDRISSKSLMRLSICLWKPSIGD